MIRCVLFSGGSKGFKEVDVVLALEKQRWLAGFLKRNGFGYSE